MARASTHAQRLPGPDGRHSQLHAGNTARNCARLFRSGPMLVRANRCAINRQGRDFLNEVQRPTERAIRRCGSTDLVRPAALCRQGALRVRYGQQRGQYFRVWSKGYEQRTATGISMPGRTGHIGFAEVGLEAAAGSIVGPVGRGVLGGTAGAHRPAQWATDHFCAARVGGARRRWSTCSCRED